MKSKVLLTFAAVALGACASQVDPESTGPASSLTPCTQVERSASTHIRLITDLEYANAIRDVLQISLIGSEAEITSASAYEFGNLPRGDWAFTENLAQRYQTAAQTVAKYAVDPVKMQALMGNVGSTPATDAQLTAFLDTRVAELWSRRVSQGEATFLKNIYNSSASLADGGAAHAFDMLLQAVLQAPSFVFRAETPAGCR